MNSINTLEREKFVPLNSGSTAIRSFSRAKVASLINSVIASLTYDKITASRVDDSTMRYSISSLGVDVAEVDVVFNSETELSIIVTVISPSDAFLLQEDGDLLLLETGDSIVL